MQLTSFSTESQKKNLLHSNEIAYIGNELSGEIINSINDDYGFTFNIFKDLKAFESNLAQASILDTPGILLIEVEESATFFERVSKLRSMRQTSGSIIILLARHYQDFLREKAIESKVNDIYFSPFDGEMIAKRINFLIKFKLINDNEERQIRTEYKIPFMKRAFDVAVSLSIIIVLLPFFLIIALLIRLESKGPIIYKSKRAGTGYKIFDFYKFRSMVVDADKKLEALSKTHNQYSAGENSTEGEPKAFVKILNDPRITKVGSFIRKTSIDELPQLFNVLKGDMSIVGNRPLPLYEAELLTSDQFALRFLGPAGITGLWQISKRGKAEMSDTERKELDNHYAKYGSFLMDIKIMLKTIPAMLQKEQV